MRASSPIRPPRRRYRLALHEESLAALTAERIDAARRIRRVLAARSRCSTRLRVTSAEPLAEPPPTWLRLFVFSPHHRRRFRRRRHSGGRCWSVSDDGPQREDRSEPPPPPPPEPFSSPVVENGVVGKWSCRTHCRLRRRPRPPKVERARPERLSDGRDQRTPEIVVGMSTSKNGRVPTPPPAAGVHRRARRRFHSDHRRNRVPRRDRSRSGPDKDESGRGSLPCTSHRDRMHHHHRQRRAARSRRRANSASRRPRLRRREC